LGDYEFQIGDGEFQTDNTFTGIETGIHTITIRDTKNICPDMKIKFTALSYPKFFTPNNDGIHDYWNIPDLKNNPEAVVFVFDRYDTLITQFKASEQGWNGVYQNGQNAIQNSYWFRVHFLFKEKPTHFQSYFSLKRN
jgi:gliding motility-associated-like protein